MTTQTGRRTRPAAARPAPPTPNPALAHLSLSALRAWRADLVAEENRVSYWRRLIQTRMDTLASQAGQDPLGLDRLRAVLSPSASSTRRAALLLNPVDTVPPVPDLQALWSRELRPHDVVHTADLAQELSVAELQLSAYRQDIHRRLADATAELIARYRLDPSMCLSVLPLPEYQGLGD